MKSTYKILSVQLDGVPVAKNVPLKMWSPEEKRLFCIDREYNLFDYPHCCRFINGSMLLSEDIEMIAGMIERLDVLEEAIVKIDYYSPLVTVNRLFLKRILQAIELLKRRHSHVIFTIAAKEAEYGETKRLLEQIQLQLTGQSDSSPTGTVCLGTD